MSIKRAPHARAPNELCADPSHGSTIGREHRYRRPCPQQHPDLDPLSQIAEQITQTRRLVVAGQPETGRNMPTGNVHIRASARERLGDPRQRLPAVNQDIERASRTRWRIASSPQRRLVRRVKLIDPVNTPQTPAMMRPVRAIDTTADPPVETLDQAAGHAHVLPPTNQSARRSPPTRTPSGSSARRPGRTRRRHRQSRSASRSQCRDRSSTLSAGSPSMRGIPLITVAVACHRRASRRPLSISGGV